MGGGGGLGSWSFPVTRNRPMRESGNVWSGSLDQAEDLAIDNDTLPCQVGGGGALSEERVAISSRSNPARPGREQS